MLPSQDGTPSALSILSYGALAPPDVPPLVATTAKAGGVLGGGVEGVLPIPLGECAGAGGNGGGSVGGKFGPALLVVIAIYVAQGRSSAAPAYQQAQRLIANTADWRIAQPGNCEGESIQYKSCRTLKALQERARNCAQLTPLKKTLASVST